MRHMEEPGLPPERGIRWEKRWGRGSRLFLIVCEKLSFEDARVSREGGCIAPFSETTCLTFCVCNRLGGEVGEKGGGVR